MSFLSAHHQCNLIAFHLPGQHNTLADALSRNNLSLFRSLHPQASPQPQPIPRRTNEITNQGTPRLDVAVLDRAVDDYFTLGLAPSTNRTYKVGIRHYISLCEQLHTEPTPTSEHLLCRFCTVLASTGITHCTIKVYLSAVRQLHVQRGQSMLTISQMPRLCQVLRGIKIAQASSDKATRQPQLPVTPETLRRIKSAWENKGLDADKVMLWAAFTLCFFCFMRSGELGVGGDGSFDPSRDLTLEDIVIDDIHNPQNSPEALQDRSIPRRH